MPLNQNKRLNEEEISENEMDQKRRNTCLIACLILILVMMLPATLALLAIF